MTNPLRCVIDTNVCIKHFISDPLTSKVINSLIAWLLHRLKSLYPICFILSVPTLFGSMFELIFTLLTLDEKLVRTLADTTYEAIRFNDFILPPLRSP